MRERTTKYHFETGMYRPPSEGGSASLLLRVTRNCPWNKCRFCRMYKDERFEKRPVADIMADIDAVNEICEQLKSVSAEMGYDGTINREATIEFLRRNPELNSSHNFVMVHEWLLAGGRTVFLQDADSLILPAADLIDILSYLRQTFPAIERVTTYARSHTLSRKKTESLASIRKAGLDRVHVGLESGDDTVLKEIRKGATAEIHIKGGKKAMAAGLQLSEYWMPGIGGSELSTGHAVNTARVLNEISPDYIRTRPFRPYPGTELFDNYRQKTFKTLTLHEQLMEMRVFVENLTAASKLCFDHAGNCWVGQRGRLLFSQSYEGYQFPDEKPKVLELIEEGLRVKQHRAWSDF